jgi:hypothetical protein
MFLSLSIYNTLSLSQKNNNNNNNKNNNNNIYIMSKPYQTETYEDIIDTKEYLDLVQNLL